MANRKIKAELDFDGKDNTGPAVRSVATRLGGLEKQIAGFNRIAKDLNRTTGEINRRFKDLDKVSSATGRRTAAIGESVRRAGPAIAAGVAVAGYAARAALLDYAALDRQMTRIGNTAGSSSEETRAAFATLQKQSKDLAMPLDEAVRALDTLVSSGMSLKEAMAFLPSVLATTQASGAQVEDIANTGLKTASALSIKANEMQHAFDLMVASGQSGQFELKDMALYIPTLANAFARLGYRGEDGLKRLMAALQTVREDTGTAEEAANDVANVFQKMGSRETISNFKKFGIDLPKEMEKAKKKGEDTIDAFVRLSNMAVKGDLTKLPLLFSDRQVLDGMTSLITSTDRLTHYYQILNDTGIDGTVARNNIRVLDDTQASVDRLSNSWEKLKTSAGQAVSVLAVPAMDAVSNALSNGADQDTAIKAGMDKRGLTGFDRWRPRSKDDLDDIMFEGGYKEPVWLNDYRKRRYERGVNRSSIGRQGMPIMVTGGPGTGLRKDEWQYPPDSMQAGGLVSPHYWQDAQYQEGQRAMQAALMNRTAYYTPTAERTTPQHVPELAGILSNLEDAEASGKASYRPYETSKAVNGVGEHPSKDELPTKVDAADLKQTADEAGKAVAEGGKQAAESLRAAAASLIDAVNRLNSVNIKVQAAGAAGSAMGAMFKPAVNADTGKSNTFAAAPPGGNVGGGGGF